MENSDETPIFDSDVIYIANGIAIAILRYDSNPLHDINRSVPDNLICVGSRVRQIGAFRPLRRDCTRLRQRRISWVVSKGRAFIFLS